MLGNATQVVSVRFWLAGGLNDRLVNGSVAELCLSVGFSRTQRTDEVGIVIANVGIGQIHNTTFLLLDR